MTTFLTLLAVGAVAGILSGMFGIGGGLIIVPGLVFFAGFSKDQAVGTSLAALIPPAGLLGAIQYYKRGDINIKYAALISVCLFLGAYFGARITLSLKESTFRYIYAGFLLVVAARMLLMKK